MSGQRKLQSEADAFALAHRTEAGLLNRRIAAAAVVVMFEMWALTAAIEAWAAGRGESLTWLLGIQCVAFLLAVAVSVASPARVPVRASAEPIGSPSPAAE